MVKPAAGGRLRAAKPDPAPSGEVRDPGAEFCAVVDAALKRGEPQAIPDDMLRRVLTAAVKAYAAKAEGAEGEFTPFEANAVTATETVVAACAMIRAADLNLFDVAMWFRRPLSGL
jgi:hypothetical protein